MRWGRRHRKAGLIFNLTLDRKQKSSSFEELFDFVKNSGFKKPENKTLSVKRNILKGVRLYSAVNLA